MVDPMVFGRPWRSARYYSPANSSVQVRSVEAESPRVVSIPVHFVASARARTAAAERIQRVFRGFASRKNVKKIARVAAEADRIYQAMSTGERSRRIRQDRKERLRVNESLMSLLFELDAVHGIDPVVRDLRKAVIRKVIALQESVDAIALRGIEVIDLDQDGSREVNRDIRGNVDVHGPQNDVDSSCLGEGTKIPMLEDEDCKIVNVVVEEGLRVLDANALPDETTISTEEGSCKRIIDNSLSPRCITETAECLKGERRVRNSFKEVVAEVDNAVEIPQVTRNTQKAADGKRYAAMEEAIERVMAENEKLRNNAMEIPQVTRNTQTTADGKRYAAMEEAIEQVMAENEKLRSVMAEMCERNVAQSRLMSSLALRVEHLERVLRQQETRKAKKKLALAARARTPL